ncbi:MAG: hypothetical protein M3Z16_01045 [Pseudomonadota bacterium]|nr:hypothetical protein [Pseudomonadota bacterium]
MKLTRKYRMTTALVALFGMLFMQLAVASHACPSLFGGQGEAAGVSGQTPMQSMPGCDQPDPDSPGLCQAHCQDAKTSLDKPQATPVGHSAAIVSSIPTLFDPWIPIAPPTPDLDSLLQRITSPPISIRHCCLRI